MNRPIGSRATGRGAFTRHWKRASLDATAEGLPAEKTTLGRFMGWLALLGAIAAFGLWVRFAIADFDRVWNRLASTFGERREASATKLEVAWLALGWALGPAAVGFGIAVLGDRLDAAAAARRSRAMEAFARAELDGVIMTVVEGGKESARSGLKVAADLGL